MRGKIILLLAVILSVTTALLVYQYVNDVRQTLDQTEYTKIVVAARDIPANTVISQDMVSTKDVPVQYKHSKDLAKIQDVLGKILIVPVTSGQNIMANQVLDPKQKTEGLAYLIPLDKRAITIPVDEVSGVAGLIRPGDRVDVIATVIVANEPYTVVPIEDVEVLAVGKTLDANAADAKRPIEHNSITLAVDIYESKRLMMASQRGVIRLMLRSPIDHGKNYPTPLNMNDLLQ